jgi:ferrochelatase
MPERHGLLLVNLGTPASTALPDIKAFLREFLMDGRVITLARPLRWLLVNGFIVPRRAPLSQRKYQRIWTAQGSPLLVHNQAFVARLQELLGPGTQVELAMRYGQPGMAAALDRLQGVARLSVLPLFPQYAEATTGSVYALLDRLLKARPGLAAVPQRRVQGFWQQEAFLQACCQSLRRDGGLDTADHVLFSFHGLPLRDVLRHPGCRADGACCAGPKPCCYPSQCAATARGLAQRLGLKPGAWSWSFQSRLGQAEWFRPYTRERLADLAGQGKRRVAVLCPSFVADCLETLEEIGMDNRDLFLASGGASYRLAACPNADEAWVQGFADWVKREVLGQV